MIYKENLPEMKGQLVSQPRSCQGETLDHRDIYKQMKGY